MREVRSRYGPHAKVVEANRVRTGGVGGFFATEHVEVVVDRGADARVAPGGGGSSLDPPSAARGLLGGLRRRHDDATRRGAFSATAVETASAQRTSRAPVDLLLDDGDRDDALVLAGVATRHVHRGIGGSVPSTERPTFAEVLDQVARSTRPPGSGTTVPGGLHGVTVSIDLDEVGGAGASPGVSIDLDAGPDDGTRRGWRRRRAAADAAATSSGGSPTTAPSPSRPVPPLPPVDADAVRETTRALVAARGRPARPARLTTALDNVRRVPAFAPQPDVVVMVVDDSPGTDRLVARLAFDLDVADRGIADHRVDPAATRPLVAERRAAGQPSIVVVPGGSTRPGGDAGPGALHELTEDLRPNQIVCCTDAARSADELDALSRAVGGIDAVAVHGITHLKPAVGGPWHLLASGIPISWLDGRRTSPALWARLAASRPDVDVIGEVS